MPLRNALWLACCAAVPAAMIVAPSVEEVAVAPAVEVAGGGRGRAAATNTSSGAVADASSDGACGCASESGWEMMENVFFTGPGKLYVTTISASAEQCRLACCYRQLGCAYFSFDDRAGTPETCTLWVSIVGNTPTPSPHYTSGKILGAHCKPPAGIDPMHPRKPAAAVLCHPSLVHPPLPLTAGRVRTTAVPMPASWVFIMVMILLSTAYLGGGAAIKRARGDPGRLPNPEFWAALGGLVYDGCALVISGGVTKSSAGYGDLSDAVNDVRQTEGSGYGATAASGATGEGDEEAVAPLLAAQASRATPNALHTAASLGDETKLTKLLGSAKCPPIDNGDTRRYTPFHVACAGGHVGAARLLRNHGADTELTNDTGLTAWELAEHLQRREVMALQSEAPVYTPDAKERMGSRMSTGDSPTLAGGGGGSGGKSKGRKSKRRESAPAVTPRDKASTDASAAGSSGADRARRSSAAAVTSSGGSGGGGGGLEESKALKAELKALGLSAKGSKAELRVRLEEAKKKKSRGM
jgi:hypothetical protein